MKTKMIRSWYGLEELEKTDDGEFALKCLKHQKSRFKERTDTELYEIIKDGFMVVSYAYALNGRRTTQIGIMFYDISFESEANVCILPASNVDEFYESDYYEMEKQMLKILTAQGYTEMKIFIEDPNPGETKLNKNKEIFLLERMNYSILDNSKNLLIYHKYIY